MWSEKVSFLFHLAAIYWSKLWSSLASLSGGHQVVSSKYIISTRHSATLSHDHLRSLFWDIPVPVPLWLWGWRISSWKLKYLLSCVLVVFSSVYIRPQHHDVSWPLPSRLLASCSTWPLCQSTKCWRWRQQLPFPRGVNPGECQVVSIFRLDTLVCRAASTGHLVSGMTSTGGREDRLVTSGQSPPWRRELMIWL